MSDIARLRCKLADAVTVEAVKGVFDRACDFADEAAAACNLALLDEAIGVLHACERAGGAMLLDGAASVRGIDTRRWRRRARMDDERFALALQRAQHWWRSRACPTAPKAVATREHAAPQARTLISDWRADELGHPTRFVVGICLARYREMTAAGSDTKKIEAELIAEALERAAAVAASVNSRPAT